MNKFTKRFRRIYSFKEIHQVENMNMRKTFHDFYFIENLLIVRDSRSNHWICFLFDDFHRKSAARVQVVNLSDNSTPATPDLLGNEISGEAFLWIRFDCMWNVLVFEDVKLVFRVEFDDVTVS